MMQPRHGISKWTRLVLRLLWICFLMGTMWMKKMRFEMLPVQWKDPFNERILIGDIKLYSSHTTWLPGKPITFMFRGYFTHILGVENPHFSWFWGSRVVANFGVPVTPPSKSKPHESHTGPNRWTIRTFPQISCHHLIISDPSCHDDLRVPLQFTEELWFKIP